MKIYTKTGDKGTSGLFNGARLPKSHLVFEALGSIDELNVAIGMALYHLNVLSREVSPNVIPCIQQLGELMSRLIDCGTVIATPNLDLSTPAPAKAHDETGDVESQGSEEDLTGETDSPTTQVKTASDGSTTDSESSQASDSDKASSSASSKKNKAATAFDSTRLTEALERWIDMWEKQLPPLTKFVLPSGGQASLHLHQSRVVCRRAERDINRLVQTYNVDVHGVGVFMNRLSDYLFVLTRVAAKYSGGTERTYKKSEGVQDRSLSVSL